MSRRDAPRLATMRAVIRPARYLPVAALAATLALLAACSDANENLSRATALHPEGREVFERYNCIRCHEGGNGGYGKRMVGDPNLRDLEFIKLRVREGKRTGAAQMPGFPEMPQRELDEVAAFVRALAGWER